jgi:putative membrane protein
MSELSPERRGFYGKTPLGWLAFSALVLAIPLLQIVREVDMSFTELLPSLNAILNATSAVLIFAGWRAIKARATEAHWKLMVAAVTTSAIFLVFYLIRFALTGPHEYPAAGWTRSLYYVILISHMALAFVTPPLVLRTVFLAYKKRYQDHRRLVRYTLPIWGYVSVTGVVVYGMLYHLGPWLSA